MLNRAPKSSSAIHDPLFALSLSLAGASLYAIYATIRFSGDKLSNQYYYVVPIIVPFVAFILERLSGVRQTTVRRTLVDALVVATAMWRVVGDVPYVSGHALFLTYAVVLARSRFAQVSAAVVMVEVIYLKVFVWQDWVTLSVGMALGVIAAMVNWDGVGIAGGRRLPKTTI